MTVALEMTTMNIPGGPGPGVGASEDVPRPPESLEEAGLSEEFVAGLVLKALHVRGAVLGLELFEELALPMSIMDGVLEGLQERRFVEVHATHGPRRGEYVFRLTGAGRARAREEMEACRYVGPAPVPFDEFRAWVERQAVDQVRISEEDLRAVLDDVELPDSLLEQVGPAINSGSSLFLHGGPGNGKTLLAERIARLFGDRYYVPYSVLVDDSVMVVYDPVAHRFGLPTEADPSDIGAAEDAPVETGADPTRQAIVRSLPTHDRRYVAARRPVVITGGELVLEHLDLQWDPAGRMYQAPPQLKAAGGVLVVDDLGRQRVPVQELLNRWVVPLEQGRDYLTPRSGRKIVVPFDCFVIFSTNLEPSSLADEAFLRRIHYKIELPGPDRGEFERIFQACCDERDIPFEAQALDYLYDDIYADGAVEPRRCHPRDVLDHLIDLARYRDVPPRLSSELLEQACRSYFLAAGRASQKEC